ncbi:MAG: efflux RND transporter periplasmic adaptor subunit [Bradyrhizobium sp.]|nr:efflux RND transporter periplasmic adaptor subunit [Bradyrhizobium sp.]
MSVDPPSEPDETAQKRAPVRVGRALVLLAVVAIGVAVSGVSARRSDETKLAKWTLERAIPTVALISPEHGGGTRQLVLPGDIDAYYKAVVYAQVSGYVRKWYKDIGAHVKAGDVLATIDTPELDQRLAQAREQLAKAKANEALAVVTAERWKSLRASGAVSLQTADEKVADETAKVAEVAAASANLDRMKALKAFANVVAPFDGVITQRNIDIGSLVSGSANASSGLFAIADSHEMRIYVKVPQSFAADMHAGMKAQLKLPQYPDREFEATLTTTSQAIDAKSRSLLVELSANNADGALQPGAFAEVSFELPEPAAAFRLPATAIIFRGSLVEVATVDANNRVVMKKVSIARDFGAEIGIIGGLSATDRVIASPLDSVDNGDEVRVLPPPADKAKLSSETKSLANQAVVQAARGHAE